MSARPRARCVRSLVRNSQRSRSEQELLDRAYELALPVIRQPLAEPASAKRRPALESFFVPQKLLGG